MSVWARMRRKKKKNVLLASLFLALDQLQTEAILEKDIGTKVNLIRALSHVVEALDLLLQRDGGEKT